MQAWRRTTTRWNESLRNFLPRLLPGSDTGESRAMPAYMMAFIALVVPILVVTAAMVMYLRYGRSAQYENYLAQAQTARNQAASLSDPIMQRDAWQSVLLYVDKAESYRHTETTDALRRGRGRLTDCWGNRLQFQPAFSTGWHPDQTDGRHDTTFTLMHARARSRAESRVGLSKTRSLQAGTYGDYQVARWWTSCRCPC
jgi:hypothetical protein